MKEYLRKGLRFLFLVVFVVSTVLLLRQSRDNRSGSESYAEALTIALREDGQAPAETPQAKPFAIQEEKTVWVPEQVEDDPHVEAMAQIDLSALRQVNPDVIGWIRIPDTRVDYPLLQGEDNQYYLKHTWDNKENSVGSVFLEHRNSPELSDYNTIVYAHNMNDGSMFATLTRYTDAYYWRSHPYVYILTDAGVWRYEVFSSYKAEVESPTYGLSFHQTKTQAEFLLHVLQKSRYDTDIVPAGKDRVLTLSTCSGTDLSKRWVVHARLKMVELSPDNP